MEKVFVAQRINTKLRATEVSIDAAMTEAAELLTTLIEARRELKLSPVVADREIAQVTQAIAALEAARHATVEAHNGLGKLAKAMHIPVKMDLVKGSADDEAGMRTTMREAS